jgi:glutamate synthase domain-containing protein 3
MTGGTVVVLGEIGRNACAGMSGGQLYVLDASGTLERRLNDELVEPSGLDTGRLSELHTLVERHLRTTSSPRAAWLLDRWEMAAADLVRVAPRSEVAVLQGAAEGTAVAGA